jgi:transcriptional regulator NrdR family protein
MHVQYLGTPMTIIVKRDGKKEKFEERKVERSIEAAAREAKLPEDRVRRLVEDVSKNIIGSARKDKEVRSASLREAVLEKLDITAPEVSRAWRDFDRRTKGLA